MHKEAWDFVEGVKSRYPEAFSDRRVLEVGSRYINGTVRTLFDGCNYIGLDLSSGPCVDDVCHVADLALYKWPGENPIRFDTIISCEALEHDKRWRESLLAMWSLLVPGGMLIITAGGTGRPEHGTTRTSPTDSPATTDYYGNITEELFWDAFYGGEPKVLSNYNAKLWAHHIEDKDGDFRFWGLKA